MPNHPVFDFIKQNDLEKLQKFITDEPGFIDTFSEKGRTPLMEACITGTIDAVNMLLDAGANINLESQGIGSTAFYFAVLEGKEDIVKLFLERKDELGLDINLQGKDGWTSLMSACYQGHTKIVEMLLDAGANINLEETPAKHPEKNSTTFYIAVQQGTEDIVKLILDRKDELGLDINLQRKDGWTPLMTACRQGYTKIVEMLLDAGANIKLELTLANHQEKNSTAFYTAALEGSEDVVKLFLDRKREIGLDINVQRKDGWTPLMIACDQGHTEIVEMLLDAGVNINLELKSADYPEQNSTAFYIAAHKGKEDIVKLFLDRKREIGLNINLQRKDGWTPLSAASDRNHRSIARMLVADRDLDLNGRARLKFFVEANKCVIAACAVSNDDYELGEMLVDRLYTKLPNQYSSVHDRIQIPANYQSYKSLKVLNIILLAGGSLAVAYDKTWIPLPDWQRIITSVNDHSISDDSDFNQLRKFLEENHLSTQPFTHISNLSEISVKFYQEHPAIFCKMYNYDKVASHLREILDGDKKAFYDIILDSHNLTPEEEKFRKNFRKNLEEKPYEDMEEMCHAGGAKVRMIGSKEEIKQEEMEGLMAAERENDISDMINRITLLIGDFVLSHRAREDLSSKLFLPGLESDSQEKREFINVAATHYIEEHWKILRKNLCEEYVMNLEREREEITDNKRTHEDAEISNTPNKRPRTQGVEKFVTQSTSQNL